MNRALHVDLSGRRSAFSVWHRVGRAAWGVVWGVLGRPSPRPLHGWRIMLLRLFGANVSWKARVYPSARVWAPWNLTMDDYATLADAVDCYCVGRVVIGPHSVVSQYTYLCGASHDHEVPTRPLVTGDIVIGGQAWIAADVFVGPGVTIGEGTVVGARSSVFKDLPAWMVCAGTPARPMRARVLRVDGGHPKPVPRSEPADVPAPARIGVGRRWLGRGREAIPS